MKLYFVVMDFEWNNTYNKALKSFFNEIIEIGAVMLDEKLELVSTFSVLIRSTLTNRLSLRVRDLTHITDEDMYGGVSREKAFSDFTKWIGNRECIFMSWGVTDIHVLTENFRFFEDTDFIPFIDKYVDMQNYCQRKLNIGMAQQIGLSSAAELLGIDVSEYSTHRALDDSFLAWRCLKRVYDNEFFDNVKNCDKNYYRRLLFKPKVITNIKDAIVDRSLMVCKCTDCGKYMKRVSPWKNVNGFFRAEFHCKKCNTDAMFSIRFKQYFDKTEIRKRTRPINKEEASEDVPNEE